MKNIKINSYIWVLASLFLVFACADPLEDDLKRINATSSIQKELVYTLTSDDYEIADKACDCAGFGNFGSEDDAKANIPLILNELYPALGSGSSVKVTYDFFRGSFTGIAPYTAAPAYVLSDANYSSVNTEFGGNGDFFFNNTTKAETYLPGILAANIASPADGDLSAVTYNYAAFEYSAVNNKSFINEDFQSYDVDNDDLGAIYQLSDTQGDEAWFLYSSSSGYQAARVGGFANGMNNANMDRLILPQIDLTGTTDPILKLNHVVNFLGDGVYDSDVAVMISTDYDGTDATTATWTVLPLDVWPVGDSYDRLDSKASLAAYANQQIYISFYYKSTTVYAPQWRVISIVVDEGVPFETVKTKEFYSYNNSLSRWESATNQAYFLSSADFNSMGLTTFGSSNSADDYLPQFLGKLLPFGKEGDEQIVIYDYVSSSSGPQVRGDFYVFTNGIWSEYQSVVPVDFSFGHDGSTWVPDNTIKYTLGGDDYTAIAAATLTSNSGGSSSMDSFGNYDISLWSSAQIFSTITDRLVVIFPTVVDQKYLVTYATWEPGAGTGTIHVIWDGTAYVPVE
jgi:hypothetical protein